MMKLLLAVIATCALVVSPTCIKIKHQLRSNAPTIDVVISNGNTQMTSQVARDGSHRFTTDNLSNMTLAPAGTQTITLSYDQIFPLTDAAVCTEVHPLSAGGCADGVCCKISISMYTITDAIIMTARVNNRKADGNPQFWKCEQEIQVPGVTNTELSPEELVTDILGNESPGSYCEVNGDCMGDGGVDLYLICNEDDSKCKCKSESKYVAVGGVGGVCLKSPLDDACAGNSDCGDDTLHSFCDDSYCACDTGYKVMYVTGDVSSYVCDSPLGDTCTANSDCVGADGVDLHLFCNVTDKCECKPGYGAVKDVCKSPLGEDCQSDVECGEWESPYDYKCINGKCSNCENICQNDGDTDATCIGELESQGCDCTEDYYNYYDDTTSSNGGGQNICKAKQWPGAECHDDDECLSNKCDSNKCQCEDDDDCITGYECNSGVCGVIKGR